MFCKLTAAAAVRLQAFQTGIRYTKSVVTAAAAAAAVVVLAELSTTGTGAVRVRACTTFSSIRTQTLTSFSAPTTETSVSIFTQAELKVPVGTAVAIDVVVDVAHSVRIA